MFLASSSGELGAYNYTNQKQLENQRIKKWEDKFDQELKLKEEAFKLEQINKKRQEESRLEEEERISKFEKIKSNKLEVSAPKEDLITKLEDFQVDNNKKN